ncbi:MAG: ATP-binding cassette domain-containing protein [Alphaproteobacteria bacterium]|nr:ATP-binding cassette domain-containing protein [Alphaproteobacteria bacterium]
MHDRSTTPLQSPSPIVAVSGLELTLSSAAGAVEILRGIDVEIGPGEQVALVGASGAGKSSMMMIVGGLERASAGSVLVAGYDLTDMSEDELALFRRENVGIVFQSFHLIPTMTALENVAIPLEFAGHRDAFALAAAELEAVGLGHRTGHYPGQLSGGEQQRVALARAFVTEPRLLLADEPTGNLDGDTGAQIIELMFRLSEQKGTTLLLITHDPALASRCARELRIADGRIVGDVTRAVAAG